MILQSELDRAEHNIRAQYASRTDQLPPADVLRRQVLERLILVRLEVARAAEMGVRVSDEEVDAAIANIAAAEQDEPRADARAAGGNRAVVRRFPQLAAR